MIKKYTKNESYMHLKAKEVLKEWFDSSQIPNSDVHDLCGFYYKPNRDSGCWLEYPICKVRGTSSWEMNWDEIASDDSGMCRMDEYIPTFDECINKFNSVPIAIIDVVCCHKGSPSFGIEICHKNPTSNEKINALKEFGVDELYEINATWILSQISRPKYLEYKQLI